VRYSLQKSWKDPPVKRWVFLYSNKLLFDCASYPRRRINKNWDIGFCSGVYGKGEKCSLKSECLKWRLALLL
jgi:hypothetical protein